MSGAKKIPGGQGGTKKTKEKNAGGGSKKKSSISHNDMDTRGRRIQLGALRGCS